MELSTSARPTLASRRARLLNPALRRLGHPGLARRAPLGKESGGQEGNGRPAPPGEKLGFKRSIEQLHPRTAAGLGARAGP